MFGIDDILMIASLAQTGAGIGGLFGNKPKRQEVDMSKFNNNRQAILDSIYGKIDRSTVDAIDKARTALSSRGTYRSGQLPQEETEIRKAGIQAKADAEANLSMQDRELLARLEEISNNQYNFDTSNYRTDQAGAGANIGGGISNLLKLYAINKGA